jgi:hypothetical protein
MMTAGSRNPDADAQAWSQLWSQTARGSIDLDADDPVSQTLRAYWSDRVPWLKGLRRVVDVGSGPAVLARHLQATAPQRVLDGLQWWCVDAAVLPALEVAMPGLYLLGETDFASVRPPDGPCDGLVSNFGLEYVPRRDLAAACARWLVPGGQVNAVVHACGSVIDAASAQTLEDIQHALTGVQLFDRAGALLQAAATLPAEPARRQQHGADARQAYNRAVEDLKAEMTQRGQRCAVWIDMLTALTALVRQALSGEATSAMRRCDDLARAYRSEILRLHAMRASAVDEARQVELDDAFVQAGLSRPIWQAIHSQVGLVGWSLSARCGADTPHPQSAGGASDV